MIKLNKLHHYVHVLSICLMILHSGCSGSGITSIPSDIGWGALIAGQDIDTKISVMNSMAVKYARTSISLAAYNGRLPDVEKLEAAGFKVLLNISNEPQTDGSPRKFPTDMTAYRAGLSEILEKYKPELIVIENEPTNPNYFDDDMSNYLHELENAIEVAHQYNVKIADGGLYVGTVNSILNGKTNSDQAPKQMELIEGYKDLDLDYVNVHLAVGITLGDESGFPPGIFQDVSEYILEQTGHDTISNEINYQIDSPNAVRDIVADLSRTNNETHQYPYVIMYSGTGDGAQPFSHGESLTEMGVTYRDSIP